jgi:hypothetical protein
MSGAGERDSFSHRLLGVMALRPAGRWRERELSLAIPASFARHRTPRDLVFALVARESAEARLLRRTRAALAELRKGGLIARDGDPGLSREGCRFIVDQGISHVIVSGELSCAQQHVPRRRLPQSTDLELGLHIAELRAIANGRLLPYTPASADRQRWPVP